MTNVRCINGFFCCKRLNESQLYDSSEKMFSFAAHFQICDLTFQNIYHNNFNYIPFILETWIHILRDILLNNVTKKYAELSVGD